MTKPRKRLIVAASGVLLLVAGWTAWRAYHFFAFGIDNAYAQWGAAEMVVDFMDDHLGRWPQGWEDLRPAFEAGGSRVGGWSFDEYCSRIWIDWRADPGALEADAARSDKPHFDIIHPADGIDVHFENRGANQILHRYFRRKAGERPPRAAALRRGPAAWSS